ncbi:MAG: MFS transporter [Thermoguttaceae bacterium]|nr:MFS transporter [Thermoguttaceae bacterium]MDW8080103.1 MFS transporter [Thermoguttaceae bacterium]
MNQSWLWVTVVAICVATFFSDVSHEVCTAVLPLYLTAAGVTPLLLGLIDGVANFVYNAGRFLGGVFGHFASRKKPWTGACYLVTTVFTSAIAFTVWPLAILVFRAVAWWARGFRSPLRDFLLAQAVPREYFGRAYGVERTADMLGAVVGPAIALGLLWIGWSYPAVILVGFVPGVVAALSIWLFVQEKPLDHPDFDPSDASETPEGRVHVVGLPVRFVLFHLGVFLFSLGNFSRWFLVYLVIRTLGDSPAVAQGSLSVPVLLYTMHNLISSLTPYPAGAVADRTSRLGTLAFGYGLATAATLLLAAGWGNLPVLVVAFVLSGMFQGIEEALEKACVAEIMPPNKRSFGFGMVATTVAVGQLGASSYVGYLLTNVTPTVAFLVAAVFSLAGTLWMMVLSFRGKRVGFVDERIAIMRD